jgi:hypothetical protein
VVFLARPYRVYIAYDRGIPEHSDREDATPWKLEHAFAGKFVLILNTQFLYFVSVDG